MERFRTHQQIKLGPEIIPEEKRIDQIPGFFEKSDVRLHVEVDHVPGYRMNHVGMSVHLDEIVSIPKKSATS
jgi:hypothetical protein